MVEEPAEVEEGPEQESNEDTLGSNEAHSPDCCGREYTNVKIIIYISVLKALLVFSLFRRLPV